MTDTPKTYRAVDFQEATFVDVDLSKASLTDVDASRISVTDGSFAHARIRDVDFEESTWTDVFLSGSRFDDVDLSNVVMENCEVQGLTINGVRIDALMGTRAPAEPTSDAVAAPTSLQDLYYSKGICFGCGPINEKGLRIKSVVQGEEVVCDWRPEPHHQAFPGILNGGIVGALLDCHSNWTAAHHLMKQAGTETPPCTVTADFHVKLLRPTPVDGVIHLRAHVAESTGDRAVIEATMEAGGKTTATCRGTFVAVKEGHPAYHRW